MADRLENQLDVYRRLLRVFENLKKKGANNLTTGLVQSRLDLLSEIWGEFRTNHRELLLDTSAETRKAEYFRENFFDTAEASYADQRGALMDVLRAIEARSPASGPSSATAAIVDNSGTRPRAALPHIQLPSFSGSYSEWASFRDLFHSLIIQDPSLKDVERLHYLKGCLKGEAAMITSNMPTTEGNFKRAWLTLKERYQNKRLLVRSQLEALAHISAVKRESASDLKRLYFGTWDVIGALAEMGRPVTNSTDWIVHLTTERLDTRSRRDWEASLGATTEPPSLSDLKTFLETRIITVEALELRNNDEQSTGYSSEKRNTKVHQVATAPPPNRDCELCGKHHYLLYCALYKGLSPAERRTRLLSLQRCLNCLGKHLVSNCSSQKRCQRCAEPHHTSIHEAPVPAIGTAVLHVAPSCDQRRAVILGLARVHVYSAAGQRITARALIDPGSEVSLIAESLATRLGLRRTRARVPLSFVAGASSRTTRGLVSVQVASIHDSEVKVKFSALVLAKLSEYKPNRALTDALLPLLPRLPWADPDLTSQDPVELLLGADIFNELIMDGVSRGGSDLPVAQETRLGWILTGSSPLSGRPSRPAESGATVLLCTSPDLGDLLERFWKQEEVSVSSPLTATELECERHFETTHSRTSEGRFIVRLPFKVKPELGASRATAVRILEATERKLQRALDYSLTAYREFMQEYCRLGHMTAVRHQPSGPHYYLPHHGILRPESSTTKLRVVFNGSMPTSSGESLNDFLHSGPNLLPVLADVLLRWRAHRVAFVVDLEKMFRQIWIHPDDRDFQRVLWRSSRSAKLREYQLNTVTYGLGCAPYLAQRCLRQLAADEAEKYPNAACIVVKDTYMDDILSGAATQEAARVLQEELVLLCKEGGFTLHKWASNLPTLGPYELSGEHGSERQWDSGTLQSVLGLKWSPVSDSFRIKVLTKGPSDTLTKRSVLSQAAQIFDPLGWLAPVTVTAKIFMQSLWTLKVDWDEVLPARERNRWTAFLDGLPTLQDIEIPRWLGGTLKESCWQIHGFCDASERAYAAAVYLRIEHPNRPVEIKLLTAKTKVAPLKQVSLPRLELCGAQLLTRLVVHLQATLAAKDTPIHLWTDSLVTLGWIRAPSGRWQTYVANRVADIQRLLPEAHWHHVHGPDNPADCASRGLSPQDFPGRELWWRGPSWLPDSTSWASADPPVDQLLPERRRAVLHTSTVEREGVSTLIARFSNLYRLLRVTAWCLRWRKGAGERRSCLSALEIHTAEERLVREVQRELLADEVDALLHGRAIPKRSQLSKLLPFLDEHGTLRVGGRLQAARIGYEQQHPAIIPAGSQLAALMAKRAHLQCLHGGVQLTLATLRQRYWLPRGRQVVKTTVHRCLRCLRYRGTVDNQLMGSLPVARVTASRPFLRVGVDYAGPILLRKGGGRGYKAYKGYVAVFVCLATRALHLEVVSDGTTEAFLAALRRFFARRGRCAQIFSDCGTVFVGANRELKELATTISHRNQELMDALATEHVEWRFNPPASPHFGGIWEAAVKSTKHHLRRVLGEQTLTYEEMSTLLAQIEACLNSRPLQPLSDDPQDVQALTPGHFLIGAPLTTIPEPCLAELPVSRLSRWQLIQQLQQSFWRWWSREYLNSLQPRGKWLHPLPNLREGDLCLIKNETQPPSRWPLARVSRTYPGPDGLTRVVELKTAVSTLTRPINKLIRLPKDEQPELAAGSSSTQEGASNV